MYVSFYQVMYPHQMGGFPGGPPPIPPNAHMPGGMLPGHLRMPIPRGGGSRFPNVEIGNHRPHLPVSHPSQHHLQNMMPAPRPHFTPQLFDPVMKNSLNQQYSDEQRIQQQQQASHRFSDNAILNPRQHLPQNQPYRQPQPPPQQSTQSLTSEQYMAGLPIYQNTSSHNMISETQQLMGQTNVPAPQVSNSLNFHDLGIAHLPLSELLHLQQTIERVALTHGYTDEIQNIFIKVREAIFIARGVGGGDGVARSVPSAHHEVQTPPPVPVAVNRNIWIPDTLPQVEEMPLSTSRIASIAQQLSEVQITEAADSIWANLGFSDVPLQSDHIHQQQHSPQNRRVDNSSLSPLMQESLSSSLSYLRSGQQEQINHTRGFDGVSQNSWSPASGSYSSLTAQLSSNDNYDDSRPQQQLQEQSQGASGGGGGGGGRSYANVARRAAVAVPSPPTNTLGAGGSGTSPSGLYNITNNESSGRVPPYPFFEDGHVSQQQAQMMLSAQQNAMLQAKRSKRP